MKKIVYILLLFSTSFIFAQTQTVNQAVPFSTSHQSMWGTGGGFSLDMDQEIFRINPSVNWNSGNGGIANVGGFDFGMAMAVDFWMDIGSNFKIQGLTLGEVDVDYPINVDLTFPANNAFEKGDTVTINTGYSVDPGWDLTTRYPTGGKTSLDLHFGFGLDVEMTFCAFGCATIPIIPNLQLPVQTMDIFALETQPAVIATYPCPLYSPCGGGLPPCLPNICTSNILPVSVPSNGLGIGGEFNLPYVVTTDSYDPATNCINATGKHDYMTLQLDIFSFLDFFASKIPPPAGPAISAVFGNLSNSFSLPFGASLDYTIFAAQFNVVNSNTQDFSFCPKIGSKFDFPMPVHFFVTDPTNGNAQLSSGYGTTVNFNLGNDINFKYPCNYEFVDITPTYSIANADNFSNHTYDVISFNFAMQAMSFSFTMPDIEIIPEICFPEICVTLCWPAPSWSNPFNWDCGDFCTPAFCIPALVFPGFSIGFGPLMDETIPLGALPPINYFNDKWSLNGFTPITKEPIKLIPRDYLADMTGLDIACKGDSTGTAVVTITNGRPPYTYVWDNLTTVTTAATSQTLTGLEANTHYVIVTNNNGCVTMDNFAIHEPTSEVKFSNIITTDASCNGNNNGQINVTPLGGTGAFNYTWSPNVSSTSLANNLTAGSYNIQLADANGCGTNTTVIIKEPLPLASTLVSQDVFCKNGNNGNVNLSVTGGTPPYTYTWSNGSISEDLNNIPTGNYNVLIKDAHNCSINNSIVITEPAAIMSIALNTKTDVLCKGGNNGALNITPSGGTPPYTYQWSNSTNIILSSSTANIGNLPADTYNLMVTDSKGCIKTSLYTIAEPTMALASSFTSTNVSCFAGNNGSIDLNVNGGTATYNYNWSNGAISQDVSGLSNGTYSVTVTDNNGCSKVETITITQPTLGLTSIITKTNVACFGDLTGSTTLNTTGGTLPYASYNWSNGTTTKDLTNVAAGNYSVTVTDAKGCILTSTVLITQPLAALLTSNIATSVSCYGGVNGAVDLTVNGGTSPYNYQWSNSSSVILTTTQQDLANLEAGTYSILVTDANNCMTSKNITINQPSNPLSIALTASAINCKTGNNGTINSTISGGTAPYSFSWSNGAFTQNINSLLAGTYTLTTTDANGCIKVNSITVEQPSSSVMAVTTGINVKCPGGNDGSADLFVSGGTPPYVYNWSNGASTQDLNGVVANTYTVTVTDSKQCIATSGVVISEPANALSITTVIDSVSCFGNADGQVSVTVSGGTLPYSIEWGASIFLMNNITNSQVIKNLVTGTYLVRVTDGNNCMVTQTVSVLQPLPMNLTFVSTPASCKNGSDGTITINVTGGTTPYTYAWSNNTTTQNQNGLPAGYYDVITTDVKGCKIRSPHIQVQEPIDISISTKVTQISCEDKQDGAVTASAFGGVGNFTYSWSNGSGSSTIENLATNVYVLTVTDANGCIKRDTVTIYPNTQTCIDIANTFTPNGDGKNDTWIIYNIWLYPNVTVKIFNEWGNLLFDSTGYETPWDGTYKGNPLPSATYYYIIDLKNGDAPYTGPITIVR